MTLWKTSGKLRKLSITPRLLAKGVSSPFSNSPYGLTPMTQTKTDFNITPNSISQASKVDRRKMSHKSNFDIKINDIEKVTSLLLNN